MHTLDNYLPFSGEISYIFSCAICAIIAKCIHSYCIELSKYLFFLLTCCMGSLTCGSVYDIIYNSYKGVEQNYILSYIMW
jgi:hypothetical protein